ncbi:MAG: glucose 1-dehydrogenase [Gammaproteobacteria bacterium]|nr:glucose 1-dehydrogenase [Gammaproteobacteria bacterium]
MPDWIERFSLAGKTALVTGASKGIGAEICAVFADAGADIIATGRDQADLEAVAATVRSRGRECTALTCALDEPEAVEQMGREALAVSGKVDILINNAGIARVAPALDLSLEDWDATMAVNLRAPFQLARLLAPAMIEQRWGKIINISSQAGVVALDDHAAYSASKAGLNALTRALTGEWAKHNIQVNAICPTVIMTPMGKQVWGEESKGAPMLAKIPLGRFGETVEVADLALFLSSPAAGLINGETILIDGGYAAM